MINVLNQKHVILATFKISLGGIKGLILTITNFHLIFELNLIGLTLKKQNILGIGASSSDFLRKRNLSIYVEISL